MLWNISNVFVQLLKIFLLLCDIFENNWRVLNGNNFETHIIFDFQFDYGGFFENVHMILMKKRKNTRGL